MSRWADYDGAQQRGYERGRALSPAACDAWRAALSARLPPSSRLLVDLGAGTGRFTGLLAERTHRLIGVEPARPMRARAAAAHPRAVWVGGRAESLPLASGCVDAVVVLFVLHHVDDVAAAAHEIARVLRPGGRLVIAGSFADRLHPRVYHHYMPGSRAVEAAMFPLWERVRAVAESAGLGFVALDEVGIEVAGDLRAHHARLSHRAVSALASLTEAEITAGLRALARDAREGDGPVRHVQDLTTFARRTDAGKG